MNPRLNDIFKKSELLRTRLLELVSTLPEEKFFYKPKGKWSVSQILTHLIQAESLSLEYMKKKSLGIDQAGNTSLANDLKFFALMLSQRLPFRYKAPSILGKNEPASLDYREIQKSWAELRSDLRLFLEKFDDSTIKRKVYRHVIAGRLNVMHAVKFFDEHLNHHLPQIKRLL
jgi:hypothetical protein